MHGSIRDKLEDLLRGEQRKVQDQAAREHLSSCAECASEVESMRSQCELLRSLRTANQVAPAAGFYARVMQRIEDSARDSVWSVFTDSPFGKRLAYASLTLAVLLGSYVVAQESRDGHLQGQRILAQEFFSSTPVVGSQAEQRDAVLTNFASHQGLLQ
jgi:predicted anti-sigma-YlaC factor YlaD